MSNLSDDTLRKILTQISTQAQTSQRALSLVKAQIQSKEKERRILQLTIKQLDAVPEGGETKMYKGVGKMFIQQPRTSVTTQNASQEKSLAEDITNLTKKAKYLEKQFNEANNQLRDIFHSQQREQQS